MRKVIAGLVLSMIGIGLSMPSMAASGDAAGQVKGNSGETGAAPKKGPSGETGTASKSGEADKSAKPKVKELETSSKTTGDGNVSAKLKEVRKKSGDEYKAAKEKCDQMKGNEKDVCVAEARAARTKARAEAEAEVKNTSSAKRKALVDIADAEYGVAKAKCKSKEGDERSKCMNAAKETRAKATLETTTQEKASTAMQPKKQEPNQDRAGTRPQTSAESK
ncbi:MAG: hypothetical protein ACO1NO_04565 [Burkholderiaceae bacterium]